MKSVQVISVPALCVLLAACSQSAPECSDPQTVDLVKQIAREELVNQFGQELSDSVEIDIEAIRTRDFNEDTGAQECAAQLRMTGFGGSDSAEITYTSERTDDGNDFYVTVYGL